MTRALVALMAGSTRLLGTPFGWSLLWRLPTAGCLLVVAVACFLIDDALRGLRRLTRRRH
jgi:hypothetical protein